MSLDVREKKYAPLIWAAFEAEGLPGWWGVAIARQETFLIPETRNLVGGDGERGGSYGICQMSLQTARTECGYHGDGEGLIDVNTNATMAAKFCAILTKRFKTTDLAEIASRYNSGRPFSKAPQSTRETYVPRVLDFARIYERKPYGRHNAT